MEGTRTGGPAASACSCGLPGGAHDPDCQRVPEVELQMPCGASPGSSAEAGGWVHAVVLRNTTLHPLAFSLELRRTRRGFTRLVVRVTP